MKKIQSNHAILDVRRGRKSLSEYFRENPTKTIPVIVHGEITGVWGNDDGISQEFGMSVKRVEVVEPFDG